MTTTRTVRYSSVESVTYKMDEDAIKSAAKDYIKKLLKVDLGTGVWTMEFVESVDGESITIHLTQRLETKEPPPQE